MKEIQLLRKNTLFSDVSDSEMFEILSKNSEKIIYSKNDIVFSKNSYKKAVGIILYGSCKVYKGKMPLSNLTKGSVFGTVTLYSSMDYFATDIIAGEETQILFIDKSGISSLISNNKNFAQDYISYLSDRVYFLNSRIDSLTAGLVEDSVLDFIVKNADYSGSKPVLRLKSYSELALALDLGRASLYRAMDKLTKLGKISRDGKSIFLERVD